MVDWGSLAGLGIEAAGAYLSATADDDRTTTNISPVQPRTTGTSQIVDYDILHNARAVEGMYNLTNKLDQWSSADRGFYENVYQGYQQDIMTTNQTLLPTIERVSASTLQANARDLVSNESLKATFRERAMYEAMDDPATATQVKTFIAQSGRMPATEDIKSNRALYNLRNSIKAVTGKVDPASAAAISSFNQQIENIPTTEERVGQALANVESQFGQAGKELAREFQSRGQTVTQASKRAQLFEKAKVKAGAAGAAAEAARAEKLAGAEKAVGVAQTEAQLGTGREALRVQTQQAGVGAAIDVARAESERAGAALDATGRAAGLTMAEAQAQAQRETGAAGVRATDVASLTALQGAQQAGLATPQVGGVTQADPGTGVAGVQAGLSRAGAEMTFGTRQKQDEVQQVQEGVKSPTLTSGATGTAPVQPGGVQIAQPAPAYGPPRIQYPR